MRKQVWVFLSMGTMCLAGMGGLAVHGLDMKDIFRSLTAEPKRADSAKNQPASTLITPQDQYRGRAQEMRPDISVPPPPSSADATQVPEEPQAQDGHEDEFPVAARVRGDKCRVFEAEVCESEQAEAAGEADRFC